MDVGARLAVGADVAAVVELAREGRARIMDRRGSDLWLHREALREPLDAAIADLVGGAGAVVAGVVDGAIVGFLALRRLSSPSGEAADVAEVCVLDGVEGIGVGEAMMREAFDWARANGLVGIGGRALPGDRGLKNLFERSGLVARLIEVYHPFEGDDR